MVRNGGILLLAAVGWPGTAGLDNGLGRLPALGWNSDYCANCTRPTPAERSDGGLRGFQYESFIVHVAETIATQQVPTPGGGSKTLQQLGYHCTPPHLDPSKNEFTLTYTQLMCDVRER